LIILNLIILSKFKIKIVPIIIYFIIFQGPLGEEIGWRGYFLPKLVKKYNLLQASLLIGLIWSCWHFQKFILVGSTQYILTTAYGISMAIIGYTFYTIMLSIIITILFYGTEKSLFAVLLFHGMANFSHGLVTILTNYVAAISIIFLMMVVSLILNLNQDVLVLKTSK